jgi:hypothetical protein
MNRLSRIGGRRRFGLDEPACQQGRGAAGKDYSPERGIFGAVRRRLGLLRPIGFGLPPSVSQAGLADRGLEATAGIEPAYTVLQTVA